MDDFFKDSVLFARFSMEEKEIVQKACVPHQLKKGDVLFKEKDTGDTCFFVADGMIKIQKKVSDDEITVLGINKKNAVFGEMALFDILPRYADAVAMADSLAYALSKEKFVALKTAQPKIALGIMDIITESLALRLRKITDRFYGIY
jgi:CRP-like cAMP-binding protein